MDHSTTLTFAQDCATNGSMLLCPQGSKLYLGFKGSRDFIIRSYNWAKNRGVISINAGLRRPYGVDSLGYVVCRDEEHILAGLTEQFRADIITTREISPLKEGWNEDESEYVVQFDEAAINRLAARRANDFIENEIERVDFMKRYPTTYGAVYGTGVMAAEKE